MLCCTLGALTVAGIAAVRGAFVWTNAARWAAATLALIALAGGGVALAAHLGHASALAYCAPHHE